MLYLHIGLVCGLVEFIEKEEEHDGVHTDPPNECFWIVAVDEKQLECMYHDSHELDLYKKSFNKSEYIILVYITTVMLVD